MRAYDTVLLSSRLWYLPNIPINTLLGPFVPQQFDHTRDRVIHDADFPPVLAHCVIEDGLAEMTPRFKCIPSFGTERADAGTSAERNRVGCVVNMGDRVEGPSLVFYRKRIGMGDVDWRRWEREVQPMRGETFAWGLKCYCRGAECSTE